MRKLYFNKKSGPADKRGERLPLRQIFNPVWEVRDDREQVNFYQGSMKRTWLAVEWLITKLLNKGVLSIDDFADFPLQDKIAGDEIEAMTDKEKKDLEDWEAANPVP